MLGLYVLNYSFILRGKMLFLSGIFLRKFRFLNLLFDFSFGLGVFIRIEVEVKY